MNIHLIESKHIYKIEIDDNARLIVIDMLEMAKYYISDIDKNKNKEGNDGRRKACDELLSFFSGLYR